MTHLQANANMENFVQLSGRVHEKALRTLIESTGDAAIFPLGILEDHGLSAGDGAPLKAFALTEDASGDAEGGDENSTHSPAAKNSEAAGLRLRAAALIGGGGGFVLPFAQSAMDAEELGAALKGTASVRSLSAPRRIAEAFIRGLEAENSILLVRPLDLYAASPDFLGPFVCPDLRPARIDDMPQLLPLAAEAVREALGEDPSAIPGDAFERRLAARILAQRTYILKRGEKILLKLDTAVSSRNGAEIEGLYVRKDARRQGLATLALGQLTRYMLGRMPRITLRLPSEDTAAAELCKRVGFIPVQKNDELRLMILR